MLNRRRVSLALSVTPGLLATWPAHAQATTEPDYDDYDGQFPSYRFFGSDPARPPETEKATALLNKAPRTKGSPLSVARYLESITDVNDDKERYNAAWAKRWNPVIVAFYKSTQLQDKYVFDHGDTIPWCAAFLNWCLEAASCSTTASASSGSFRKHGKATDKPVPGDIVVFQHGDPEKAKVGRGHVGLFVAMNGDKIQVLGGNQRAGKRYSSINVSEFSTRSAGLEFHSFRSVASLPATSSAA